MVGHPALVLAVDAGPRMPDVHGQVGSPGEHRRHDQPDRISFLGHRRARTDGLVAAHGRHTGQEGSGAIAVDEPRPSRRH